MPLTFVRQDITRMRVDAIVNAANERLSMGGGVCGAIFRAAGERRMREACLAIGHVGCGNAVATPGFDLPARWVIHTAGPRWDAGFADDAHRRTLLASCYTRSLDVARGLGAASVAFPLVSSGAFGCPKDVAMDVATTAIRGWLCDAAAGEKDASGEKDDPRDM
ncbi:MAG: macro domain-containing protein, partial [Parafannyhessea sp.]|uniref:macro domain-containing protein n=1 Tax=Parafannyhessea sp. TaxID=2847324 RepID=UPI003F04A257